MTIRAPRLTYNRVSVNQDAESSENQGSLDEPLAPTSHSDLSQLEDGLPNNSLANASSSSSSLPPIRNEINVTLLDSAQTKFNIKCDPSWKVSEFKSASATVTMVPPQSQRLIHMGKLLQDEKTLGDFGIKEDDKIIHLFPKPNVVITAQSSSENDDNARDAGISRTGVGAHVPQIVLDAEEATRRSQILILSSQEIFEAQHRVKIFSFLLMIISSMELLNLFTLIVGVQGDGDDYGGEVPPGNPTDSPPATSTGQGQLRTWQNSDYADFVISSFGFYVSLLGIKATTENTLQLAKRYFGCLVVAGVASNCYYYFLNIQSEEKSAQGQGASIDGVSKYAEAFIGILVPLFVWMLCILRAWQFQSLIRDAENEAEERTRAFAGGDGDGEGNEPGETSSSLPYGSGESGNTNRSSGNYDDLELQVERGSMS